MISADEALRALDTLPAFDSTEKAAMETLRAYIEQAKADECTLRASVPERHKECASPVGCVQSYIVEMEQQLAEFGWDALYAIAARSAKPGETR